MPKAIGMIEMSSIALAYQVEDAMLKAAEVELLMARTICSGKYIIIIGGEVGGVQSAVEQGLDAAHDSVIETLVIPNVHDSLFPALSGSVALSQEDLGALGVVETFSAASILAAADAAVKASNVKLFRVHVAMAIGGKGFLLLTGEVGAVQAAVDAGVRAASDRGMLVGQSVIAGPREELFREYI
jgi:microcompartment protein CcmL/EutN